MTPEELGTPCDGCGALAGEDCFPGCTGYASMRDDLIAQSGHVIARAMTVEASKLYARLYFRHQLNG